MTHTGGMTVQVRLRFLRAGSHVEPTAEDLAALGARYTTLLAKARFGASFEVKVKPVEADTLRPDPTASN